MTGCCCCQTKSTTTTADGWWCHLLRIIIPRRDAGRVSQHCWEQRLRVTYGRPGEPCCTLWCTQIQIQDYTNTEIHKYELLRIHLAAAKAQFVFAYFIKSIFSLSLKHTCCIALVLQCVWNVATVGDARNDYLQWRHGSDTQTGKATDPCLGKHMSYLQPIVHKCQPVVTNSSN